MNAFLRINMIRSRPPAPPPTNGAPKISRVVLALLQKADTIVDVRIRSSSVMFGVMVEAGRVMWFTRLEIRQANSAILTQALENFCKECPLYIQALYTKLNAKKAVTRHGEADQQFLPPLVYPISSMPENSDNSSPRQKKVRFYLPATVM